MSIGYLLLTLILLLLSITIGILYSIVNYISVPGSILAFIIILWLIIRKAVEISLFPGSNYFWRRDIESNYLKEISFQISEKLRNLKEYLENVKQSNLKLQDFHFSNSKILINSLIDNYSSINKPLSRHQKSFYILLIDLKKLLENIEVIINDLDMFTLYDWLEIRFECAQVNSISIKTQVSKDNLNQAIMTLEKIDIRLAKSYQPRNCVFSAFRWLFDDTIGSVDYMRADLQKRFNCEEFTIVNGKEKINCTYITGEDSKGTCVFFCNPNAGYYEFTYFQSEWLEFYISRNIDIILWNYRGFGKSTGKPNIKSLIEDGKLIIKHIRENYIINKLGIHGESLGGCIAIHIAEACDVDFLFADRTFGCLSDTILFTLGRLAYYSFFITGHKDIDSVLSYLKLRCYKVIASDPCDDVICDLASLKNAVAYKIVEKIGYSVGRIYLKNLINHNKTITEKDCHDICLSIKRISDIWLNMAIDNPQDKYQKIIKTETFDDNEMKTIVNKIIMVITEVNAGGMALKDIIRSKFVHLQFYMWLVVLEVWGCYGPGAERFHNTELVRSIADLRVGIVHMKEFTECRIWKDAEVILRVIEKISDSFQLKARKSSNSENEDNISELQPLNAGFLMPIACGHSGQFSNMERNSYDRHLCNANFA
ncbi:hypothetical protein SteCoe_11072 [Stentor coeruleus]|uniref:Serine aminopeptidase S33 domain-containing protein n=1 Tax=Stentor coeruleus TaxID=5963 RepID=A0A1R2CE36_9CILI|nr:hypothetical protein SteCoe_11072 [Stentor coeruleus]